MKKPGRTLLTLALGAVVLTLLIPLGKRVLRPMREGDRTPVICELAPAGIDKDTCSLLAEATVTLAESTPKPGLMVAVGEEQLAFPLTETEPGKFTGAVSVPLEIAAQDGFQLYLTREKLGMALIQDPLGRWNGIGSLLPVRFQSYQYIVPKFQTGPLRNGVLTTRMEDICLKGGEDGGCAVELRAYRGGALVQTAAGAWDAETGRYYTEELELPCAWGDQVRLAIGCRDAQGVDYAFTLGRWEITDGGELQKLPDLAGDDAPVLTWE